MLKNNIRKDINGILIEKDMTQADLAAKAGTSATYVSRLLKKAAPVNPKFIEMCNALGYDLEIIYVKKE